MTKLGLVLSGGGSKGAYQIGVYRALRKLGKRPEIVTGTSIGAVNGLLIVQGDLYKAAKLWKNMSFSTVYDEESFHVCENPDIAEIYSQYVKSFISEGGMDVTKLMAIFDQLYEPRNFFDSPIDYGLVTYNYSQNKPVMMTKKDLKPETVKDYVVASASCYPAFKPYKIGDEIYIDGGYYDNLPINLAIDLGAEEVVAVDLKAVGFKREPKKDIPITVITPRNKIVSFLVFDKMKSREALRFGYNDTMKTYGKLDGDRFTFKKGNLVRNYNKYAETFENEVYKIISNLEGGMLGKIAQSTIFQTIVENKLSYRNFNKLVEKAGACFGFQEDVVYNIRTYNKGLFNELSEMLPISREVIVSKIKKNEFKKIIDTRQIVRFFYDAIINNSLEGTFKFLPIFSDEFLIALYIYVIKGRRNSY